MYFSRRERTSDVIEKKSVKKGGLEERFKETEEKNNEKLSFPLMDKIIELRSGGDKKTLKSLIWMDKNEHINDEMREHGIKKIIKVNLCCPEVDYFYFFKPESGNIIYFMEGVKAGRYNFFQIDGNYRMERCDNSKLGTIMKKYLFDYVFPEELKILMLTVPGEKHYNEMSLGRLRGNLCINLVTSDEIKKQFIIKNDVDLKYGINFSFLVSIDSVENGVFAIVKNKTNNKYYTYDFDNFELEGEPIKSTYQIVNDEVTKKSITKKNLTYDENLVFETFDVNYLKENLLRYMPIKAKRKNVSNPNYSSVYKTVKGVYEW